MKRGYQHLARLNDVRGVCRAHHVGFQFDINLAKHFISANVLMASY